MREYGSEHPAIVLPDGYFNHLNKLGREVTYLRSGREALLLSAIAACGEKEKTILATRDDLPRDDRPRKGPDATAGEIVEQTPSSLMFLGKRSLGIFADVNEPRGLAPRPGMTPLDEK